MTKENIADIFIAFMPHRNKPYLIKRANGEVHRYMGYFYDMDRNKLNLTAPQIEHYIKDGMSRKVARKLLIKMIDYQIYVNGYSFTK